MWNYVNKGVLQFAIHKFVRFNEPIIESTNIIQICGSPWQEDRLLIQLCPSLLHDNVTCHAPRSLVIGYPYIR